MGHTNNITMKEGLDRPILSLEEQNMCSQNKVPLHFVKSWDDFFLDNKVSRIFLTVTTIPLAAGTRKLISLGHRTYA